MIAPGQPPASDSKCRVLSLVRHAPLEAADLSRAYMTKVSKLAVIYRTNIKGGILDIDTETPTTARKIHAITIPTEPLFLLFDF